MTMVRTVEEEGEQPRALARESPEVSLRESEREGVDGLASRASEGSPLSPSVSLDKVYSSSIFILLFVVRPSVFRRLLFLGPLFLLLVLLHLRFRSLSRFARKVIRFSLCGKRSDTLVKREREQRELYLPSPKVSRLHSKSSRAPLSASKRWEEKVIFDRSI